MDVRLSDFMRSEYAQFGHDGVIEKIIEVCGIESRYFVEFGSSGDDLGTGNTPNLRRHGWDGLLMDKYAREGTQYPLHKEHITAGNVESIFAKHNVPERFGFLSIDIDGQDYWVWDALKTHRPDIVCIESNHYVTGSVSVPLNDDFEMTNPYYFGASKTALRELGLRKGYWLVAVCVTDMIFVRHDLPTPFRDVGNIRGLDVARTDAWVSKPIADEVAKHEWVHV